eukprot:TRINITY_DN3498_c0_g2_i2.p1 TRINITY_DN3498_c0_g2~~TRINITY_DN3498_c0_g2_i2.p1  ORF type:complete len:429 (+),score=52.14 TRINITY_DN3498_c0_g2_i2:380-1666(+)
MLTLFELILVVAFIILPLLYLYPLPSLKKRSKQPFLEFLSSLSTQPQERSLGSVAICQLIQNGLLLKDLTRSDLLNLMLLEKNVASHTVKYVSNNFMFNTANDNPPYNSRNKFRVYNPVCVKVISNLRKLLQHHPNIRQLVFEGFDLSDQLVQTQLTHLNLLYFNENLDNKLPHTLTHLDCGSEFNSPLSTLPCTLTHLKLGHNFNQPLFDLPNSLTHLYLGYYFNQPLSDLPSSLVLLKLEGEFNLPLSNLPNTLTYLKLSQYFNQPVDATTLPHGLKYLVFGAFFDSVISSLPPNLVYLRFKEFYDIPLPQFPHTLVKLHFGKQFCQPLQLPSNLQTLVLGNRYDLAINFPPSLKRFVYGPHFSIIEATPTLPQGVVCTTFSEYRSSLGKSSYTFDSDVDDEQELRHKTFRKERKLQKLRNALLEQ